MENQKINIKKIRETFEWTQHYDKNNNELKKTKSRKLKDLSNSHILGILQFFTQRLPNVLSFTTDLKDWKYNHLIFIKELKYRLENNIIIKDY